MSINTEKFLDKIQPFMVEAVGKLEIERNFLNLIKNV
jgi:hypothetical protein